VLQHPTSGNLPTLTVGQLNREARRLLESHFDYVWVEGEISNFAAPSSGHWYFSLKDSGAQVRCAMFRNRNQHMRVKPANGMAIRLRCRVSLYEGRGEFQLIVEHLEHAGAGALQAAFERLRDKLQVEGLFAAERKRALPAEVRTLGVITSASGAAIHDVLTVLRRRCPGMRVLLLPVAVQGEAAAGEIAAALAQANRWQAAGEAHFDALLVTRGGGSLEDLWAFNEEVVARAIAASALPVVSAVGHEVDISIADMVADQRAPTPSAAAELLSPDQRERAALLHRLEQAMVGRMRLRLERAGRDLYHLRQRLRHPGQLLREQSQRLDELEQRLLRAQRGHLREQRGRLAVLEHRIRARSPEARLHTLTNQVMQLEQRLQRGVQQQLRGAASRLSHLSQLLDSVSPLATLIRGYSILRDEHGAVVRDADSVREGSQLDARLARGELRLQVLAKR
jgi:exodeoxyribonuclease VII large subunit